MENTSVVLLGIAIFAVMVAAGTDGYWMEVGLTANPPKPYPFWVVCGALFTSVVASLAAIAAKLGSSGD